MVAKEGATNQALWITKVANPSTGAAESVGGATECTCEKAPAMLVWKCDVVFSLHADQIGTKQRYEWAVDGDNLRSFLVGPDGKRDEGAPFRRPK